MDVDISAILFLNSFFFSSSSSEAIQWGDLSSEAQKKQFVSAHLLGCTVNVYKMIQSLVWSTQAIHVRCVPYQN